MDSLDNLLAKRLNKLGLSGELKAAYVLSQANMVGKGRFVAVRYSNEILTVNCPSSIDAQAVRFASLDIIDEINAKIKPLKIKRLSYRVSSQGQ